MTYQRIKLEKVNAVATITLNRPERHNALDLPLLEEFGQCIEELREDNGTRAIIITGAGRSFCSGMDVEAIAAMGKDPMALGKPSLQKPWGVAEVLCSSIRSCRKPTIAAVNGAVIGIAVGLILNCDYRIASDQAAFGAGLVKLGLAGEIGMTYLLPRIIGLPTALEFLSTGAVKDAAWAERCGLVREVVPAQDLMEASRNFAAELAKMPPLSIETIKQLVYNSLNTDFDTQCRDEALAASILTRTHDHGEATQAFLEKRAPRFLGK